MKLATFDYKGETRIGVVTDKGIVDLAAAAPSLPRDMVALISSDKALAEARAASAKGDAIPLADVHLRAPVPFPGKVLAIGLNYRDHV
ncbi:MAG: Rv2993c-like domain-containing protein, partial [Pseudomonadota bacterium]